METSTTDEKQLDYAMGDVTHLRDAYQEMLKRLEAQDRLNWVQSEMAQLVDPALYDTSPENAWKRLKMRKPNKEYAAVFASVAGWREDKAQKFNKPRRRILKDDAIQEIADQKPQSEKAFERLRAVPKGFIRSKICRGIDGCSLCRHILIPMRMRRDCPNGSTIQKCLLARRKC